MTTLIQTTLSVPAAEMNGESTLPLLYDVRLPAEPADSDLGEDDALFLNYGGSRSAFPYKSQDCYGRELTGSGIDAVVLENEHLRATFTPGLGGKLWSLYDKDAGRELLFANHVYRPAYLALRNAWASGGVEWNCGASPGHHPHTCDRMFTAVIDAKDSGLGCPVLRMYHFERIRAVTQQMDFYLPDGAKFLHCRMRVVNDSYTVTPMYWWSNIAVPSDDAARVVVPADFAFTPVKGKVTRVAVPHREGIDVSYPTRNPIAIDYFFKTYDHHRHYTSHLGADGYGLVQTSTDRLKGRKLFVWGRGQGGRKWQEYLSGDDGKGNYSDGRYCEIQCGLANTQYETLPMPPKTAWEWIEYYGPMKADPAKIHGEWHDAQTELEALLDKAAPLDAIEKELLDTHEMAVSPASRMLAYGDGWAALENLRREKKGMAPLCPHLDYGTTGPDQAMWKKLLAAGSMRTAESADPSHAPVSYQRREEWVKLMKEAAMGPDRHFWLTHYLLGCAYLAEQDVDRAESELELSCSLCANAWNTYAIAELYRVQGDLKKAAMTMLAAAGMAPDDASLCKMTARTLAKAELWDLLADYTDGLSDALKELPRIKLYRAISADGRGDIDLARALLEENGGLEIPDIQEGEVSITDLWFSLAEKKAARDGVPFDRSTAKPPQKFDFRMNVSD
ncbi:MAG: DUF5107 domain-containing protein [Oscillospiraceae bacterium]|nr:DUF5107 domain-containing protein [Oscillospiraceae bacterium]